MDEMFEFTEMPTAENMIMILGWRQWADAGSISSGLPDYLIKLTHARKIGEMMPEGYYLFQIPGTHHLLRPVIRLEDGYRQTLEEPRNEFYYARLNDVGVVIFLGDEPHMNVQRYARVLLTAVQQLHVAKVASVAGVYGSIPYDKDRQISCIYSLPHMKAELEEYALSFSNYEGGSSIDSYLVSAAEKETIPFVAMYGFVPAYNFSQSALQPLGIQIENDYKAWYDILHRLNHMFALRLDLTELGRRSENMLNTIEQKIDEIADENPDLNVRAYLAALDAEFTETSFLPLDDIWEEEFRDLFGGMDEDGD